jgi:hypothetical protein
MRRFLLGAFFGAAAATMALSLFGGSSPTATSLMGTPGTGGTTTQQPSIDSPVQAQDRPVGSAAPQAVSSSIKGRSSQVPELAFATRNPAAGTDSPIPIRLSADHARMLAPATPDGRPPTLSEQHMQLLTEAKDPSWSLEMEQDLSQFIGQGNGTGEFEILSIECRTSACEILAFGNLPTSSQRWNLLGAEMNKQPWSSNFQGNSTSSSAQNGRTTIVTILQRRIR